ncbi:UDP-N-acetylmuramoylalanine--D-glutamate ligase [Sinobacterium norvegicum]|uniref:UDP-N-acetylmuramoylalanine--D-glutamate ligase n=1 Tax=Sinobacterium norvegicum TaxID=1641715 RepID=A0ABN8EL77_9GAMM|nr:UDP-N-acetylmuramoyl-L-alanine--D-glutamate ligase [Sinobacterium norvegicum]CAH0993163.1 UDP-N-acetylmuramoylalanine--D-glutamate ligase [Sinobacterium norvegicum]
MSQLIASDRNIAIIGLGKSGVSAARFLTTKSIKFDVFDSREMAAGADSFKQRYPGVNVHCGELSGEKLACYQQLVVSPGVSLEEPAIAFAGEQGAELIGDISLFCQYVDVPFVAITGSNAKSTVTTWVGDMAERDGKNVAVGGNLGTPALDLLLDHGDAELYIIELSSFQLERTEKLTANVATVLNVSEDHLDRYSGMMAYQQSKQRIYRKAESAVYNRADVLTQPLASQQMKLISFGLSQPDLHDYGIRLQQGKEFLAKGLKSLMAVEELSLPGRHNIENALASAALAECAGISLSAVVASLKCFTGLRHRCQQIAVVDGVKYFNDSKGTNVGASIAAIDGLAEDGSHLILIAGGVGKGADFSDLAKAIDGKVSQVILIGEDAELIATLIADNSKIVFADDMAAAVSLATATAQVGDTILLSPACASFDMFNSFEHRGEVFEQAVMQLEGRR